VPLTKEEFLKLTPDQREAELDNMRLRKEFKSLPDADRDKVLGIMKAAKEAPATQGEAAARGTAQGFLFNFADELSAGISAAGARFIGMAEFQPTYQKALEAYRARDKLAKDSWPKTFMGTEIGGGVLAAAIPVMKPLQGAAKAKVALSTGMQTAERILGQTTAKETGKGFARGVAGVAKGTAGGAAATLGASENKSLDDLRAGATAGGAASLAANIAGPALRKTVDKILDNPKAVLNAGIDVVTGGISSVARTALSGKAVQAARNAAAEAISKKGAKVSMDGLNKALTSGPYAKTLTEVFEKQGGAGLAYAHYKLLSEDPNYSKFIQEKEAPQTKDNPPPARLPDFRSL